MGFVSPGVPRQASLVSIPLPQNLPNTGVSICVKKGGMPNYLPILVGVKTTNVEYICSAQAFFEGSWKQVYHTLCFQILDPRCSSDLLLLRAVQSAFLSSSWHPLKNGKKI